MGEEIPVRPEKTEIAETILRHARSLIAFKGEHIGSMEMRKHAAWYLQGIPGATRIRRELNELSSYEQLEEMLKAFLL